MEFHLRLRAVKVQGALAPLNSTAETGAVDKKSEVTSLEELKAEGAI
jgi:hypothetical protein